MVRRGSFLFWTARLPEITRVDKDRRQELVFIAKDLDQESLRQRLEQSLVTEVEFEQGREEWARWPNPFKGTEKPARKKGNLAARRAALRRKRAAAAPAAAGDAPQASRPKKAKTVQQSQKSGQGTSDAEVSPCQDRHPEHHLECASRFCRLGTCRCS